VNTSKRALIATATILVGSVLIGGVTSGTAAAGQAAAIQDMQAQDEATLYVVQGLPGAAITVAVDGQTVAQNVQTTNVVGPFEVSAGARTLTFTDANGTVVAQNTVDAGAGSSSDLVLHLTSAAGDPPVVTQFPNDLTGVPGDKASLTVAHTAAVPPADIRVDGKVLFANIANGESLNLVVPVGSYQVDIVPAGESSPVVLIWRALLKIESAPVQFTFGRFLCRVAKSCAGKNSSSTPTLARSSFRSLSVSASLSMGSSLNSR